jgi:hypothetical protein
LQACRLVYLQICGFCEPDLGLGWGEVEGSGLAISLVIALDSFGGSEDGDGVIDEHH